MLWLTSLTKACKCVLEVVIATICKCWAGGKIIFLFGIKRSQGTSNHPQHLMDRAQLISTSGLTAVLQPLKLIVAAKAHLRACSLRSVKCALIWLYRHGWRTWSIYLIKKKLYSFKCPGLSCINSFMYYRIINMLMNPFFVFLFFMLWLTY